MKKADSKSSYYPIFLKIDGKKCVVVGGGRVARRKAQALLGHGGSVTVISPELCLELAALAASGRISTLPRHYQPGDLRGAFIAIAATDDRDINRQVIREARERKIPVNVADDPENSDFIMPSYTRRGEVAIAISTGGRSPALARKIRTRLEKELGEEYATLARLIGEVREEVKRQGMKISGESWQKALDLDLMIELLKNGETEKARTALQENLKAQPEYQGQSET